MGKELYESVLILVIMINTTCNTTFFAYKIFNCITNFIMPILILKYHNNTKYLISS